MLHRIVSKTDNLIIKSNITKSIIKEYIDGLIKDSLYIKCNTSIKRYKKTYLGII